VTVAIINSPRSLSSVFFRGSLYVSLPLSKECTSRRCVLVFLSVFTLKRKSKGTLVKAVSW
jgi:hypothetical protein